MALKTEIESLREATEAGLSETHDHFVFTKKLWVIVADEARLGKYPDAFTNLVTGAFVTGQDLSRFAAISARDYLPSATIQQLTSVTEIFLADLVRFWLVAYPMHLKGSVDVQSIIAAPDKKAILGQLIDQHVIAMSYKKPAEWFKHLNGIVSVGCPSSQEIEQFAEFKATRDVFVHNRGIVNEIYLEKSGTLARAGIKQPLDLPDSYLHEGFRICRKIVNDVGNAAAARA